MNPKQDSILEKISSGDMATYKCRDCSHEIISNFSPSECEICGSSNILLLDSTRLVSEVDKLRTIDEKVSKMGVEVLLNNGIVQKTRGEHTTSLTLKRTVNVKVVVTPRWKKEKQEQLRTQLSQTLAPEKREEIQQQLKQVQDSKLNQEIGDGQIDSLFQVSIGDNLISKMQVEVLLNDGIVQEIRGAAT